MIRRRAFLPIALYLLLASTAMAIKVSPPPSREYVSQTWVGFSVDDKSTLRLTLNADGTGFGVLVSYDERESFIVTSWTLNRDVLNISLRFANHAKPSRLTGKFKTYLLSYNSAMLPDPERVYEHSIPGRLELSFEGSSIRFGLWPEKELDERIRRVTALRFNSEVQR